MPFAVKNDLARFWIDRPTISVCWGSRNGTNAVQYSIQARGIGIICNFNQLDTIVEELLKDEGRRKAITEKTQAIIAKNHTYI